MAIGRKPLGVKSTKVALTHDINAGLARVSRQTGWSKNALIRLVLSEWLDQIGLVSPDISGKLTATRYKNPNSKENDDA